jgi:hypothetical protein
MSKLSKFCFTQDMTEPNQIAGADQPDIINQNDRVFIGMPNPKKDSAVKTIYTNDKGKVVCSAVYTDGSGICISPVTLSNGRCKSHGGKSLSGVAHPNFSHGRFSYQMPSRLAERYQEALDDPKLNEFKEDLAILDARLADLFAQMDEGGGADIFKEIKESHQSLKWAIRDGDRQAQREAQNRLDDAIKRGSSETYVWSEVRQLQEQRRKIILAEAKRLQLTGSTITIERANLIVAALLDAVRRHVTDKNVLQAVVNEFQSIMTSGSRKQLRS